MYIKIEKNMIARETPAPRIMPRRGWRDRVKALVQRYARLRATRRRARAMAHLSDRIRADIGYPRQKDPTDFWSPRTNGCLTVRGNR